MPTPMEILDRVITVIARIKNVPPSRIRGTHELRQNLGFTDNGVAALAHPLNQEFAAEGLHLTGPELLPCVTVNDVALLIANKLGVLGTAASAAPIDQPKPKRKTGKTPRPKAPKKSRKVRRNSGRAARKGGRK